MASDDAAIIATLEAARARFLALVAEIRPDLHRYCARMTGSIADGEDVVQDTLARACYQLSEMKEVPPLRPWLFRIAHNRAIDHHRSAAYRTSEPLDAAMDLAGDEAGEPDQALARSQAVRAAISSFLALAPAQRGCVILKDVLEHTHEEIAEQLDLSVPAVKAALHRGRAVLRDRAQLMKPAAVARTISPALVRYANLFNAHDWDGVRAMLADDVRLDLVSRRKAAGRREVGVYFTNYDGAGDWHLTPGWLDGREVLVVSPAGATARKRYFIDVRFVDGLVSEIRDYRYVGYIGSDAAIELQG